MFIGPLPFLSLATELMMETLGTYMAILPSWASWPPLEGKGVTYSYLVQGLIPKENSTSYSAFISGQIAQTQMPHYG